MIVQYEMELKTPDEIWIYRHVEQGKSEIMNISTKRFSQYLEKIWKNEQMTGIEKKDK